MSKKSANIDRFAAIATELVSDRHSELRHPQMVPKPANALPLEPGSGNSCIPKSKK
jgi:hypothetical protein